MMNKEPNGLQWEENMLLALQKTANLACGLLDNNRLEILQTYTEENHSSHTIEVEKSVFKQWWLVASKNVRKGEAKD